MAKTLSERLSAQAKTSKNQNHAIFLALREEIQQAMQDGWPVKAIWALLKEEGKINIGYYAFNKQVNRLIKSFPQKTETLPLEITPPVTKKAKPDTSKTHHTGFTFNPTPKKEDLL